MAGIRAVHHPSACAQGSPSVARLTEVGMCLTSAMTIQYGFSRPSNMLDDLSTFLFSIAFFGKEGCLQDRVMALQPYNVQEHAKSIITLCKKGM